MLHILDPDQAPRSFVPYVHKDIPTLRPPRLRRFGYHPPLSKLESGDLLLFSPKSPSPLSRFIIKDQRLHFDDTHARWTHAAVYVCDGKLVEAIPRSGTTMAYLHHYIPTHSIRVRRNTSIGPVRQTHIALNALSALNTGYPLWALASYMVTEWLYPIRPVDYRHYNVCSELFHKSFIQATKMLIDGCPNDGLTKPAHLSMTETLSDIEVPWMKLEP